MREERATMNRRVSVAKHLSPKIDEDEILGFAQSVEDVFLHAEQGLFVYSYIRLKSELIKPLCDPASSINLVGIFFLAPADEDARGHGVIDQLSWRDLNGVRGLPMLA